jgi:hypothetical protein
MGVQEYMIAEVPSVAGRCTGRSFGRGTAGRRAVTEQPGYAGDDGDYLGGGAGDDLLYGGAGAESLDGQWGHDTLWGGGGGDSLEGGDDNDTIYVQDGDTALGGWGDDTFHVLGTGECVVDGGWYEYDTAFLPFGHNAALTSIEDENVAPDRHVLAAGPSTPPQERFIDEEEEYELEGYPFEGYGAVYELTLDAFAGVTQWLVDWNDGTEPEIVAGAQAAVYHVYASPPQGPIWASVVYESETYWANAVYPAIVPMAPTSLSATGAYGENADLVRLTWENGSDIAQGFQVAYAPHDSGQWTIAAYVAATAQAWILAIPLESAALYDFRVSAYCNTTLSDALVASCTAPACTGLPVADGWQEQPGSKPQLETNKEINVDGTVGVVTVRTKIEAVRMEDGKLADFIASGIAMKFAWTQGNGPYHWVQFIKVTSAAPAPAPGVLYGAKELHGEYMYKLGDAYCDVPPNAEDAYYDMWFSSIRHPGVSVEILDQPTSYAAAVDQNGRLVPGPNNGRLAITILPEFDAFLVDANRAYWHVHWRWIRDPQNPNVHTVVVDVSEPVVNPGNGWGGLSGLALLALTPVEEIHAGFVETTETGAFTTAHIVPFPLSRE